MLQELFDRRSIRRFTQQPVPPEVITELLRAAMNAPSARNTQSWRFLVVTDRASLDAIPTFAPYVNMMREAQAAILVLGSPEEAQDECYLHVNCAAAIENMLIEAVHQGLGACWCAITPGEERVANYRRFFRIPDTLVPMAIVALGYPAEQRPRRDQYDPEKVSYWEP